MSSTLSGVPFTAPANPHPSPRKGLSRLAWINLGYLLFVILWGAFVRVTGSGAGCGEHWPLCNGEVIPRAPEIETLIELTHRVTSGLSLVLLGYLVFRTFRTEPRGSLLRRAAVLSAILLVLEALIGAGLVLFALVAENASIARAIAMGLHLVNTLLLLGALGWVGWLADRPESAAFRWKDLSGPARRAAFACLGASLLYFIAGFSGAIAALGDTLFPVDPQAGSALPAAIDHSSHFLVRLRVLHPLFALISAFALAAVAYPAWTRAGDPTCARSSRGASWVLAGVVLQVVGGIVNVWLRAPATMQIIHLLVADLLWIAFIRFALDSISERRLHGAKRT